MLEKLFGKKETVTEETIFAPATGRYVQIDEVPDPTFAKKMMGEGVAIDPSDGKVVSPVDGEVLQVFPTKHAVGIKGKTGVEILIHIGLETVTMNGEGFETHVKQGDKVKVGETLVTFDLNMIKEKAVSTLTPIVITNSEQYEIQKISGTKTQAGTTELFKIKVKA